MFFDTEPQDEPATTPPQSDPALDEAMKNLPHDPDQMLKDIQGGSEEKKD